MEVLYGKCVRKCLMCCLVTYESLFDMLMEVHTLVMPCVPGSILIVVVMFYWKEIKHVNLMLFFAA